MNQKKQLRCLFALELLGNTNVAGGVWVLLLVSRGFSLLQVGLAEAFFHVVSMCCEIPSGMLADVLGRRRTLMAGQCMFALSALCMVLSQSMTGVCIALGASAMAYNLTSGTREAITYDSLVQVGAEGAYLRTSSTQNALWRCGQAISMLFAGVAVSLGHVKGYGADALIALMCVCLAGRLTEPAVTAQQHQREIPTMGVFWQRMRTCAREAAAFLRKSPRLCGLMLLNALVGACATLLAFFLQDLLMRAGAAPAQLGPMLLLVAVGGIVGARLAIVLAKLPYAAAGVFCTAGVAAGVLALCSGVPAVMVAGGFVAVACDDSFQVLTDNRLNQQIPSDQRATLISVSSMVFSVVMIALSPLGGLLAGRLVF